MKSILVFGTFDILHAGHFFMLRSAKTLGDYLTVVVARDVTVRIIKKNPPVHTEQERKRMLLELRCVDAVVLGDAKLNVYRILKKIQPDIIALGYDQTVFTNKLQEKIKEFGLSTKVIRLKPYKNKTHKSSKILKRFY